MRFEDEPDRPYLDDYPFKRAFPYPYNSDLYHLWKWAETIRYRRERQPAPYDENETILEWWQSVEHALLHFMLDYAPFVDEIRRARQAAKDAYAAALADWREETVYQFDQRLGELSARVLRVTELINDRENLRFLGVFDPKLTPNEARAKFCFEEWQAGKSYKEINAALKRHPEWESYDECVKVRGPIESWAKRLGVVPRKGQPGRPSKKLRN